MPALALAAQGGKLSERVARLLDMRGPSRRYPAAAAAGLLCGCLLIAGIVLPAIAQPKPPAGNSMWANGRDFTLTLTSDQTPSLNIHAKKMVSDHGGDSWMRRP